MPEFPLSLRLIGLRVTKLKDLKEDERKGIKRVRFVDLLTKEWYRPGTSFSSQLE